MVPFYALVFNDACLLSNSVLYISNLVTESKYKFVSCIYGCKTGTSSVAAALLVVSHKM